MNKLVPFILVGILFCLYACSDKVQEDKNFGSVSERVSYLEGKIKSLETRYDILARRIDSNSLGSTIKIDKPTSKHEPKNSSSPVKENVTLQLDPGFYDDAYIGSSTPDILIVVYSDLSCENCKTYLLELIPSLRKEYKSSLKVQTRLRDFPLEKYPMSSHLAEATHCVGEQGHYWNFLEILLKKEPKSNDDILKLANNPSVKLKDLSTLSRCLKSNKYEKEVTQDKSSGNALGVVGVPSVFIGKKVTEKEFKGALIRGSQDISIIHKYIEHLETAND